VIRMPGPTPDAVDSPDAVVGLGACLSSRAAFYHRVHTIRLSQPTLIPLDINAFSAVLARGSRSAISATPSASAFITSADTPSCFLTR